MMHNWLQFVPFGLLLLALCGGFYEVMKLLYQLGRSMGEQNSRLTNVEKQFKPNGGSTLKDDLNEVKAQQLILNTRFDDHLKQHSGTW